MKSKTEDRLEQMAQQLDVAEKCVAKVWSLLQV